MASSKAGGKDRRNGTSGKGRSGSVVVFGMPVPGVPL